MTVRCGFIPERLRSFIGSHSAPALISNSMSHNIIHKNSLLTDLLFAVTRLARNLQILDNFVFYVLS